MYPKYSDKKSWANTEDLCQTPPNRGVWSAFTVFYAHPVVLGKTDLLEF